jgi:hypothetical protein
MTYNHNVCKAAKITAANVKWISDEYEVATEDIPELLPVGYIVVAGFGSPRYEGVLTQNEFDALYTATGLLLENTFFEVVPK